MAGAPIRRPQGESALLSPGGGVLVAGDVDLLEHGLDTSTIKANRLQVEEHHVVVGAVCDELVATRLERVLHLLGVLDDLLLVLSELGRLGLLERHGKRSDGVVVGTTLVTWEDREVDGTLEIIQGLHLLALLHLGLANTLAEEDHGTTRATERLVGGGRHDVRVWEWGVVDLSGDQARDVGHVHHQVAADLVRNLSHLLVVNRSAVCRSAGDDDLGAVHHGILLELLVVDNASLEVDSVGEGLEVGGHSADLLSRSLVAVAQVTAVGKIKTHDTLVRAHDRLVDLQVGGRARQTLDVHAPVLRLEMESLERSPLARKLDLVDVLVTTIVPRSGVALTVLVAHAGTERVEDGTRSDVLRGDQKNRLALALDLLLHDLGNLRVSLHEGLVHEILVGLR